MILGFLLPFPLYLLFVVVWDIGTIPFTTACSGSNSTHISWVDHSSYKSENIMKDPHEVICLYETIEEARITMTNYLATNMMKYDVPFATTLGFNRSALFSSPSVLGHDRSINYYSRDDKNDNFRSETRVMHQKELPNKQALVDGLSDGILNQTLYHSLLVKSLYPWSDFIPRSIYLEYVLPYAIVNEPRTDNRPLLFNELRRMLNDWEQPESNELHYQSQTKHVVKLINTRLWSMFNHRDNPIVFQPGLTPRIFDPMSVIAYGYSSCTGLAILMTFALRSVGIAARLVGTPAWHADAENGNHSWLEVYVPDENGGRWIFLEPTPGIAEGDENTVNADDLDRDPCKRWFCNANRFNGSTHVFAARYTKIESNIYYPMAWAIGDDAVPGEDRTEYYTLLCGAC